MKLLYFLYVLLFFQNVKFCSRTTPAFLCATEPVPTVSQPARPSLQTKNTNTNS